MCTKDCTRSHKQQQFIVNVWARIFANHLIALQATSSFDRRCLLFEQWPTSAVVDLQTWRNVIHAQQDNTSLPVQMFLIVILTGLKEARTLLLNSQQEKSRSHTGFFPLGINKRFSPSEWDSELWQLSPNPRNSKCFSKSSN